MALAPFCLRDRAYLEFYRRVSREGDIVILDNGAYEGCIPDFADLISLIVEIKPAVIVAPDVPRNYRATKELSSEFCRFLMSERRRRKSEGLRRVQALQMLHAEDGDLWQFIQAYKEARARPWIGFSKLTNNYGSPGETPLSRRYSFALGLQKIGLWRSDIKHHAFGMLNGNTAELKPLTAAGFYGCDSSTPVWRGLHGFALPPYNGSTGWPDIAFSSQASETRDAGCEEQAERNLKEVLERCKST